MSYIGLYFCICREGFDTSEERTIHMATCPDITHTNMERQLASYEVRIGHLIMENDILSENLSIANASAVETDKLRTTLRQIAEECGPPKMSETVGTMFSRIKHIKKLVNKALNIE